MGQGVGRAAILSPKYVIDIPKLVLSEQGGRVAIPPPKHAIDDPKLARNECNRYTLPILHFSMQGTNHHLRFYPRSQNVWGRREDRRTDLRTLSKLRHKRRVPLRHGRERLPVRELPFWRIQGEAERTRRKGRLKKSTHQHCT